MADGDKNPKLDFKSLKLGNSVTLKLDCTKAVKTGESSFGTWNMWFAYADGTLPVTAADKKTILKDYKGKVIFFPSKGLNRDLEKAAAGKTEVEVKITKTAKEGQKGLLTVFVVEKLSEGKTPTTFSSLSSPLTEIEQSFVNEMTDLINEDYNLTIDLVLKAAKQPDYQISEVRAKELFSLIKK